MVRMKSASYEFDVRLNLLTSIEHFAVLQSHSHCQFHFLYSVHSIISSLLLFISLDRQRFWFKNGWIHHPKFSHLPIFAILLSLSLFLSLSISPAQHAATQFSLSIAITTDHHRMKIKKIKSNYCECALCALSFQAVRRWKPNGVREIT